MIPTLLRAFVEHFAQGRDVYSEVHFLDERIRPDFFQDFILRDQPPVIADEIYEGVKDLRREGQRRSIARNYALGGSDEKEPNRNISFSLSGIGAFMKTFKKFQTGP